jgi:hypothetical protein
MTLAGDDRVATGRAPEPSARARPCRSYGPGLVPPRPRVRAFSFPRGRTPHRVPKRQRPACAAPADDAVAAGPRASRGGMRVDLWARRARRSRVRSLGPIRPATREGPPNLRESSTRAESPLNLASVLLVAPLRWFAGRAGRLLRCAVRGPVGTDVPYPRTAARLASSFRGEAGAAAEALVRGARRRAGHHDGGCGRERREQSSHARKATALCVGRDESPPCVRETRGGISTDDALPPATVPR